MINANAKAIARAEPESRLVYCPPYVLDENLEHYRERLERALDYDMDEIELVEVMQHIRGDHWLLLEIEHKGQDVGLMICERIKVRGGVALMILSIVGEGIDLWADDIQADLQILACSQGCDRIRLVGRMGWSKYLMPHGYESKRVIMECQVNG